SKLQRHRTLFAELPRANLCRARVFPLMATHGNGVSRQNHYRTTTGNHMGHSTRPLMKLLCREIRRNWENLAGLDCGSRGPGFERHQPTENQETYNTDSSGCGSGSRN